MAVQYDLKEQERIYETWAKFYDRVYLKMLEPAQRATATAAGKAGRRILEVGVGTGLVLRYYPASAEVVGIDLSVPMLKRAQDKAHGETSGVPLPHVAGVAAMDACNLGFADEAFDVVTVPFVITLVPDPERALSEIARVLKSGGEIVIASRLGAEDGLQARFEEAIAPLMKKVGWSSSFKLSRITSWAKAHGGIELVDVKHGLFFKVVRLKKA